jgi:hypothetical protein
MTKKQGIYSMRLLGILPLFVFLMSCSSSLTKYQAFRTMYDKHPLSVLVLPPINETTAADASDYYSTTVLEPMALKGYYVYPIEVVFDLLKQEGYYDSKMLLTVPPKKYQEYFGADAVLYIRLLKWDKSYYIIGGNVTVSVDFQLVSALTGETLWQYNGTIKLDTSGKSGGNSGLAGLAAALITTAVKTATTDYLPLAKDANIQALSSMPYGKYHSGFEQDKNDKVNKESIEKATIKGDK